MQTHELDAVNNVQKVQDSDNETHNEIFESEEEMMASIKRLCDGDFYILGRLWIAALKSVLIGAKLSLISTVHAAAPVEKTPEKPPPMKYQDLPIYESPHYEYKDYIADKKAAVCPTAKVKLLHQYLFPKVKDYRKSWNESIREFVKDAGEIKDDACSVVCQKKKEVKDYLRNPENMTVRQAIVAAGAVTGFYLGSGRYITRRLIFTSVGAMSAGALCFPKETDEIFRNIAYYVGKAAIALFNSTCGHNFTLRERITCPDDFPPPPSPRPNKNPCEHNKGK